VTQTVYFDNPSVHHCYYGDERGTPGTIMTTFAIRRPITRTQRRAEVARRLPVDAEIMISAGREIIGLFGVPATTRNRNTITAIARVLGKGGA